ncbi:MAG: hypothetical protein WDA16_03610 [Candidatus Thermoplasmatota archaeon]
MAATSERICFQLSPNAGSHGITPGQTVVFFGNNLGADCQRCGAYDQTFTGHRHCAHVSCPLALREFKRRTRKRTTSLEKVFIPQRLASAKR